MIHRILPRACALILVMLVFHGSSALGQRVEDLIAERPATYPFNSFGWASAIDGEWAVVGDLNGSTSAGLPTGSCTVYRRTPQGWALWQVLTPNAELDARWFGIAVALLSDEIVVGDAGGGQGRAGRVHIFRLVNEEWIEVQELRAFDGALNFTYGRGVALDEETLVVGSPFFLDFVAMGSGAAYVYERGPAGWELSERISVPSKTTTPHGGFGGFGWSCDVEEDVIVIGAPLGAIQGHQGMAFVYRRTLSGWRRETDLYLPQFSVSWDFQFGWNVDVSGGTIAVAAPVENGPNSPAFSSVWMFDYDSQMHRWQQVQGFRASDWSLASVTDAFGASLVLHGDRLLVGAPLGGFNGSNEGTAYMFERTNGTWEEVERLVASDPNPGPTSNGASFGNSVAMDDGGNRILIGAPNVWVPEDAWYSGSAYFFDLNQGTVVCSGIPNETEAITRLTVTGNRVVDNANVSLSVYDGPPGKMGIFLVGPGGPSLPLGAGASLCVGQPFTRLSSVVTVGPGGGAMHQVDFSAASVSSLVIPGASLTFQFVHRDVFFFSGMPTVNTSDAVEVVFE